MRLVVTKDRMREGAGLEHSARDDTVIARSSPAYADDCISPLSAASTTIASAPP
jgi:hypothetical protein